MVKENIDETNNGKISPIKSVIAILLSTIVILTCSFLSGGQSLAAYSGKSLKSLPIYRVKREDKKISISFDCAWGVDYTDKILEELEKFDVKCTFFAVKFWVDKYPDYVKKISASGHDVETHSATHSHMSKLSKDAIINELNDSKSAIEKLTRKSVTLFRPPFGEYDDLLIDTAKQLNLYSVQWDVDSLDWKNLSATEIANRVLKRVKSGSIILCHNNGLHTYEALPMIFSTLISQGFTFVPITQLIYKENYFIASNGEQSQNH